MGPIDLLLQRAVFTGRKMAVVPDLEDVWELNLATLVCNLF
jgi:hypothetical protein